MANCGEMWSSGLAARVLQRDEWPGDGKTIPSWLLRLPVACSFTPIILGVAIHVTLGLPYGQGSADPGLNKTAVHKACAKLASEPDRVFCVYMRKLITCT